MQEFLKEYYGLITLVVEFIAALTGIVFYKKYKHSVAKYLVYFLIYVFFVELVGGYPDFLYRIGYYHLIQGTLIENNYWWFTIFWFFALVSFISYVNYNIIKKPIFKKTMLYVYITYSSLFVLYFIINFEKVFLIINPFLMILSLWAVFVFVCIYLVDILQSEKVIYFYKSIYFYINSAIFFWSLLLGPMVFYEIYFSTADWNFIILKYQIYLSVNVIFYLTLSIALICCKPEPQK